MKVLSSILQTQMKLINTTYYYYYLRQQVPVEYCL